MGHDEPSTNLLKPIAEVIFEPHIFPSRWKSSRVTPLYKQGYKSDVSNHRPNTILSPLHSV